MNAVRIKLLPEHQQVIRTHAESTYPDECCGIMLGYLASGCKTVVEVIPTANAWNTEAADFADEPTEYSNRRRYAIAPGFMLQAQRDARNRNLNIIGIYHSHPDYPAIPSEWDRLYAWTEYSYIIVSVQNRKAGELNCWSLDESHQFQAETIESIN
ncbi:putative metal-dependent protease of the PAD1/JAB1 superfamily [Cylindrospermum stagnale PCC 7417]|uniref:Putative metal-dependent protease of the PAD1/JAB1 superfamily n=1 Tax=Cylindrospermum stagnale PCC 7417 TaxID=56107 RepID=K9WRV8_9NOST|nr:M67 family metallopeptidase [Cylindrospermum stagnale]AFZ22948.1 putative metal-dependent protease of the PAD1/JAB1 superfamily [Cylindrospermum stagnale PCC 7417]